MKKKTTQSSSKAKTQPQNITCASKITPTRATLESAITPEITVNKSAIKSVTTRKDPRLPAVGTTFTKCFKGKELHIEVTENGLLYEGKIYKSLSGLAMEITQYPISGYVFFHKELLEWQTK